MRSRFLFALGLGLLLSPALQAEGDPGLPELRQAALERSSTLASALLAVDSAALTEKTLGYELLPSLSASASSGLSYALGGEASASLSGSLGLSLSQTVYDGGAHTIQAAIDALGTESARVEAKAAYFEVLRSVESAYYAYLEAVASVEAAESDLASSRIHLELARAKLEAGAIAEVDLLEAESEASSAETSLSQAKKSRAVARAELASLTGLASGENPAEVEFAPYETLAMKLSSLSEEATDAFVAALVELGRKENPSLAAANLSQRSAEKEVELAKRDAFPTVSASYSHSLGYGGSSGLELGSGSLSLSARISVAPWSVAASVKSANLAASRSALSAKESGRSLDLSLSESVYGLISAARGIDSSALALKYAEGHYQSVLELFKLSAASSSDLSDAEALVSTSRQGLINARYGLLDLISELKNTVGSEDESLLLGLLP